MESVKTAIEIEQELKTLNDYLVRGSYSLTLCSSQAHNNVLDEFPDRYLTFIEKLKSLATNMEHEIKEARSLHPKIF